MTDIVLASFHALASFAFVLLMTKTVSAAFRVDDLSLVSRAITLVAQFAVPDAEKRLPPSAPPHTVSRSQILCQFVALPRELSRRIESRVGPMLRRSRFATIAITLVGIDFIARGGAHLVLKFPGPSWTALYNGLDMIATGLFAMIAFPLYDIFFGEGSHVRKH